MNRIYVLTLAAISVATLGLLAGCGNSESATKDEGTAGNATGTNAGNGEKLSGSIKIDGSSTVYKITAGVAEAFMNENPDVNVTVNISGTGGGFKKFTADETDISDASRPIKAEEIELGTKNGVEFVELPVGYDGLTVVVNPKNTWATSLTMEELKKIWEPNSTVKTWKDVRPTFPDKPIKLYGPGTDSGTFDFFTKVVVGKEKEMRKDFQSSEDDNVIVTGVSGDEGAMGYFGMAYWEDNMDKVKALSVDGGKGAIMPSTETVSNLSYPLSRPEFIYVKKKSMDRPEVKAFVEFYLGSKGQEIVKTVGYVPFKPETYDRVKKVFADGKTGSHFQDKGGQTVEDVLSAAGY